MLLVNTVVVLAGSQQSELIDEPPFKEDDAKARKRKSEGCSFVDKKGFLRGPAQHRGSVCASHPAAPGSILGTPEVYLAPLSQWLLNEPILY